MRIDPAKSSKGGRVEEHHLLDSMRPVSDLARGREGRLINAPATTRRWAVGFDAVNIPNSRSGARGDDDQPAPSPGARRIRPEAQLLGAALLGGADHPDQAERAGDGNRTRTTSLEGWSSTIELHPRDRAIRCDPRRWYPVRLSGLDIASASLLPSAAARCPSTSIR